MHRFGAPPLAMTKGYTHMSAEQITMAKRWRAEGLSFPEIGHRLQRSVGTVYKQITKGSGKTKPKGYVDVVVSVVFRAVMCVVVQCAAP